MNRANRPRMSRISGSSYDSRLMSRSGDGSTLSLDFTAMGGTLDPRITFSRTSPATFINSLGYVQYADANMIYNSVLSGAATPSGWSLVAGGAGATIPSDGIRRFVTTTAAVNFINSAALSTSVGTVYASTVNLREVSGQHYRNAFEITAGPTILKYYRNGVQVASGTGEYNTAQAGLITVVWIAISTNSHNVRHGVGCTGSTVATAVCEFEKSHTTPVFFSGTTTATSPASYTAPTYVPNTDTAAAYHAPRFDYDPVTLAAKGLLLEAPATNLLNWSQTFATTGGTNNNWADTNLTRTSTNNTSPDNGTTALRITASAANGTIISSAAIGTSASRVLSVWLRRVTGTGNIQYTLDNGTSYTTQAITSSWVRYSFPATTAAQRVGFRIVTSADAIEIWGAQLETTASTSYIPTGSSQVTRAVDTAIIAGTNFSSWYTGGTTGTFVTEWCRCTATTTQRTVIATSDVSNQHLHQYIAATTSRLRLADKVPAFIETANASVDNSINKGAFSYSGSVQSLCLNGGTVVPGTLTFTTAPTWLSIGGPSTNGTSITDTAVVLNNAIRKIKYFPTRLSDAQLQTLSTL